MRMKILYAMCALAVVALTACGSGSGKQNVVTVTVPPSRPAAASPSTTDSHSASPSPSPTALTKLPGTCDDLLPDYDVSQALGGNQLAGNNSFIVGQAERGIARLAYINCRYGVTGTGAAAKAKVEIGVSLYSTAAKAAARIQSTTDDYTAHGATAADVTADGQQGSLLTGGAGADYEAPLLIIASGQRTVAVNVDPSVASGAALSKASTALATLALRKTGG